MALQPTGLPIPLTSGAYTAASYIASAQRCVNLIPEKNPENIKPPMPVTHYARPGLLKRSSPPVPGRARCLYTSTKGNQGGNVGGDANGELYAVVDQAVYFIDRDYNWSKIGQLVTPGITPVSIADNGFSILIVDGSAAGYQMALNVAPRAVIQIGDPVFVGADKVDFLDTFLVTNQPGSSIWGSTLSGEITFNALYVGVKTAWPDNIVSLITFERQVLLLGPSKGEIWFNAGAVPFPFQILPNIIIEQGCGAKYSLAKMDTNAYWLSRAPEGDCMVMRINAKNVAERISTHAIEKEFKTYARIDDAIGSVYQLRGHSFYKLHFPTADKTWGFDEATGQWHEDSAIDFNGDLHRARNTFCAFAYGKNLALDFATGDLYEIDEKTFTDNGVPIAWIRSFPHVQNELKKVGYSCFTADVETGTRPNTGEAILSPWSAGFSSGFGPLTAATSPALSMRYSKDGGRRYSNNRQKMLVGSGHYRSMQRWRSLGLARDMVFELSSTVEMIGALNGAYVDVVSGST